MENVLQPMTVAQLLDRMGIDARNARARVTEARWKAERWVNETSAPDSVKRFVRHFIRAGTDLDMPAKHLAVLVAAVLYVICPIDAIPDFLPVIGWSDDISVIALATRIIGPHWQKHARAE